MAAKQLQEDLDKFLECPICLEQIKQPKMLPCQHSFCMKPCLENMMKELMPPSVKKKFLVTCPICRDIHSIDDYHLGRDSALSTIPDNLQMKNLLDIWQKPQNEAIHDSPDGINFFNLQDVGCPRIVR